MEKLTTIEKIIAAIIVMLVVVTFAKRMDSAPSKPVMIEPLKAPPAKVLDLGMTLEEFTATYNLNAMARNVPQLMLKNVEMEQDAFSNKFIDGFWLLGYVDKTTGKVTRIMLAETPSTLGSKPAALAFLIMVETLSPELTKEERAAILNKFSDRPKYSSTIEGNVRYTTHLSEGGMILNFSAEAKDLK